MNRRRERKEERGYSNWHRRSERRAKAAMSLPILAFHFLKISGNSAPTLAVYAEFWYRADRDKVTFDKDPSRGAEVKLGERAPPPQYSRGMAGEWISNWGAKRQHKQGRIDASLSRTPYVPLSLRI